MKRRRKHMVRLAVALLGAGVTVAVFYGGFAYCAARMADEAQLPPGHDNAVKHAYAAAQTYRSLRLFGIPEFTARAMVIWLGELHEKTEHHLHPGAMATTLETLKDLCNNRIGIATAIWHERHPAVMGGTAFSTRMRQLIHKGPLRYTPEAVVPPGVDATKLRYSHNPAQAITLSHALCGMYESQVVTALDASL
jgi:hypothetical protein